MLHTNAKWLFAVLGIMMSVFGQSARADWEYTRWGMTVDQVQSASKGKLRKCSAPVCRAQVTTTSAAQLYGEFNGGHFNFTVFALFELESGRLSSIKLRLWDADQTDALVRFLLTTYGEPERNSNGAIIETYVWQSSTDQITLLAIHDPRASTTTVTYRAGGASSGLRWPVDGSLSVVRIR